MTSARPTTAARPTASPGRATVSAGRAVRARPVAGRLDRTPGVAYGTMPGGGEDVVLVHGLAARWQVMRPLMTSLTDVLRPFAPDLRGHGASDRATCYELVDFARDLVAFVEAVPSPPVHLVGHSLGGILALLLAADRPDLVRTLVVIDSTFTARPADERIVNALLGLPLVGRSLSHSAEPVDPALLPGFRTGRTLAAFDAERVMPRVRCPVLLLQADPGHGGVMSDEDVARARDLLASARHYLLPGRGHALPLEDAPAVAAAIRDFCAPPAPA